MRIAEVKAVALSYDLRGKTVTLGTGTAIKRDVVVVKVRTEDGLVGYGEAHHALAPTVIADLVNTSLAPVLHGQDAMAVEHLWEQMYFRQGRTHGPGWAIYKAMSGVDLALWDVRGKALQMPLWRLLGGTKKRIRAYAGGVSLNYQPAESLGDEARGYVERGFSALKLRLGDSVSRDLERVRHVRGRLGDQVDIMVDVNTRYTYQEMLRLTPGLEECGVYWIEEPFPPDAVRVRAALTADAHSAGGGREPLSTLPGATAAGGRRGPDSSARCFQGGWNHGGQEDRRPGGSLSASIRSHTSMSGINSAATLHLLSACSNSLIYEADVAPTNPFRDDLASPAPKVGSDGCIEPYDAPGLGIEVDESLFHRYPGIPGPCYV